MRDDACIGIVGTGLIGGSLALALKQAGYAGRLGAYDPVVPGDTLREHFVDWVSDSPAALVEQCDVVVLATPVGASLALLDEIASVCLSRTVLTDVGSTKQAFVDAARHALRRRDDTDLLSLVPGHPIAGSEKSGIGNARADLFLGRTVVLTPMPATDAQAVDRVTALWEKAGARVTRMDAAMHDELFAMSSHLPHTVAYALIDGIAASRYSEDALRYCADGLRDFTRVAGSNPLMWRDICLHNRENLLAAIAAFEGSLDDLRDMIASEDGDALLRFFERSNDYCCRMGTAGQTR